MQKFESEIKQLSAPQVRVYEKFSDLRNLQALRERLNDPLVQEKMQAALSDEQVAEAKKQLETLTFDADNVTIQSPVGQVTLTVVEREQSCALEPLDSDYALGRRLKAEGDDRRRGQYVYAGDGG